MTDERKQQLALMYLKNKIRRDGIMLSNRTAEELKEEALALGISENEATEFTDWLVRDLADELFGKVN